MPIHLDLTQFLAATDVVARFVLGILLLMSVITWTVILARGWRELTQRRRHKRFLARFWHAPSLDAARETLSGPGSNNAFANVARHGFAAVAGLEAARVEQPSITPSSEAGEALIKRMLERGIAQGRRASEFGLGALASVASAAPFVGLFGTVWGVYQALVRIGLTGQGTLDKVAGPIGEALIMTALGLAVAIPAVLAYNYFARRSRHLSADLGSFAGDLMALLHSGWKAPQLLSGDLESAVAAPLGPVRRPGDEGAPVPAQPPGPAVHRPPGIGSATRRSLGGAAYDAHGGRL
jgi:biopolymer transport protein ExbB